MGSWGGGLEEALILLYLQVDDASERVNDYETGGGSI
jgi:hypothetical protein